MRWLCRLFAKDGHQPVHRTTAKNSNSNAVDQALVELDALIDRGAVAAAEAQLAELAQRSDEVPLELRLRQAGCTRLRGDSALAKSICEELLSQSCDASLIQLELGLCAVAEHDLTGAVDHFEVAVSINEENARAWLQLGKCLARLERWRDAEPPLRHALNRLAQQSSTEAWYLLGEVQRMQHRFLDARQSYERCIALEPDHLLCHIALGHVLMFLEEENTALTHYESAMAISPRLPATLKLNVGTIQQNLGRYDDARTIFEALVRERPGDPIARWYLCQLDLLQCRWEHGWANYQSRFGAKAVPYRPMPYPTWDGRTLANETLLILADEGLGDEIMFASCLPEVTQRAQSCIIECDPRLRALLHRSFPNLHVVGTNRESNTDWLRGLPTPSWQIFAGDLPGLFRRDDSAFLSSSGYLKADPERVAYWRHRLLSLPGAGPFIGVSWRGGITGTRTMARSISTEQWAQILGTPGVRFVNLQYGNYRPELEALQKAHGTLIHDFPDAIADYNETAALVCALNLVVSVCTAIVHLSGALGCSVWVLTPFAPGWRYTASRERLPWYPSSRIFRQHRPNEWHGACRDLSLALQRLTISVTDNHSKS